jgi:hypothetical protein
MRTRLEKLQRFAFIAVIVFLTGLMAYNAFLKPATVVSSTSSQIAQEPDQSSTTDTSTPTPDPSVTPAFQDDAKGYAISQVLDTAMTTVTTARSISYLVPPAQVVSTLRQYTTLSLQQQIGADLQKLDWAAYKASKYITVAETTKLTPHQTPDSVVPQSVDVAVTIYRMGSGAKLTQIGTEVWNVTIGLDDSGWHASTMTKIG